MGNTELPIQIKQMLYDVFFFIKMMCWKNSEALGVILVIPALTHWWSCYFPAQMG